MDLSKKQIGIFLVSRQGGLLFLAGKDNPITITFPKNTVSHLEIIDRNSLEQVITTSITKEEIKHTTVYIVLDKDITFHKELKNIPFSLQSAEVERFIEMVPFHHILTKTYNFSNKTILVAANKDFCEGIVNAFVENQSLVGGIMPLVIFEEKLPQLQEHFDAKLAFKKIETLKQYFLSADFEQQEGLLTYTVPSLKNPQFIVLISIFILVLVILGVQIWTQVLTPSAKPHAIKATIKKSGSQLPPVSPSAATQSATVSPSSLPSQE